MFKVSFKNNSKKVQVFNGKATIVTLTGSIKLPRWFTVVPRSISDWGERHPTVDFFIPYALDEATITVSGKSVCSERDSFDSVLGEKIAESRAKIRLYKFMATFTDKMCAYFFSLVYGGGEVTGVFLDNEKPGIYQDRKKYAALLEKEEQHFNKLLEQA